MGCSIYNDGLIDRVSHRPIFPFIDRKIAIHLLMKWPLDTMFTNIHGKPDKFLLLVGSPSSNSIFMGPCFSIGFRKLPSYRFNVLSVSGLIGCHDLRFQHGYFDVNEK